MLRVTIHSPESEVPEVHTFDLVKAVRVGRGEGLELHLDHDSVSATHAVFAKQDARIGLVHLGSPKETFVNGKALEQTEWVNLSHNDEVKFGEVIVKIELRAFSSAVIETLKLDPVLAKDFLYMGASLTQLGYEERLFQNIWAGKQQATVLHIKKANLPKYERWAQKYQLRGLVAPDRTEEEIDLLIYKEDRIRELIESWEKIQSVSNLTSAWFMAMLFQWPEKFIDRLLKAAQKRK